MQHPTVRFGAHDMFDSLRRWTGQDLAAEEVPISAAVDPMDAGGVDVGLLSARWAPGVGELISNDEVAGWVAVHPDRLRGSLRTWRGSRSASNWAFRSAPRSATPGR